MQITERRLAAGDPGRSRMLFAAAALAASVAASAPAQAATCQELARIEFGLAGAAPIRDVYYRIFNDNAGKLTVTQITIGLLAPSLTLVNMTRENLTIQAHRSSAWTFAKTTDPTFSPLVYQAVYDAPADSQALQVGIQGCALVP
ncbi:MAG: hypothetical protein IT561_00620 [Alphaproteobacteria bacterium]|nr:hypothetical protein [Alphaproteobacteria bacterium]